MLDAAIASLGVLFSWPYILYPIVGTLLSMLFSALPGIGGVTLMALALPFVYEMEPIPVLLLFGAFVGGATFMGSISAILLGIPGKATNAATVLDGYPMAQQGLAKTAIGCSAAASALGSTFGIVFLLALLPILRETILLFGPTEFLALAVWGLTTVALVTRGSSLKALVAAVLGLLVTFVGTDPRTDEPRFAFDTLYLRDGLDFPLVFLGLFSLAEVIDLLTSGKTTISGKQKLEELQGSAWEGCLAVFRHWGVFVRSSIAGTVVGMIPGIGGTISSFVAYGLAVRGAGADRHRFGKGDIRGVLAPEAAHDAKDGGALAPALVFGVPGGAGTAMLLIALQQQGIAPGRELMTTRLDYVFLLIFSLFLSNWLTSILGLALVRPLSWLTVAPAPLLTPFLLLLTVLGAYVYRGRIEDVFVVYVFGLLGYCMKRYGWSRAAMATALVLGGLLERSFTVALRLHELDRVRFWERPITLALIAMILASLYWMRQSSTRRGEEGGSN
jgi:TctA family transporter